MMMVVVMVVMGCTSARVGGVLVEHDEDVDEFNVDDNTHGEAQVELTCESLGAHPPADILWRHGDGTLVTGWSASPQLLSSSYPFHYQRHLR